MEYEFYVKVILFVLVYTLVAVISYFQGKSDGKKENKLDTSKLEELVYGVKESIDIHETNNTKSLLKIIEILGEGDSLDSCNVDNLYIMEYDRPGEFEKSRQELKEYWGDRALQVKMSENKIMVLYESNPNPPTHECLLLNCNAEHCQFMRDPCIKGKHTCRRLDEECIFCNTKEHREELQPLMDAEGNESEKYFLPIDIYNTQIGNTNHNALKKNGILEKINPDI